MSAAQHDTVRWLRESYERSYRISIAWAVLWGVVALWIHSQVMINSDSGWLVHAAGRYVRGAVPYIDFFETNPPLILWINWVPAWFAVAFSLPPVLMFHLWVLLAAAASLTLTLQEIKNHPWLGEPRRGNVVFAALAQLALGCSVLLFGQREHFMILLVLPYLIMVSHPEITHRLTPRRAGIAVLAGLGFALKPFFVLIWLAGEACLAFRARSARFLWRPVNIVIAATGLGYVALTALALPEYFTHIVPYLSLTYDGFNAPDSWMFRIMLPVLLLYFLPLWLARPQEKEARHFSVMALCWLAATAAIMWAQGKGWINHAYPMFFIGTLLAAGLLAAQIRPSAASSEAMTRRRFALLWTLAFVCFLLPIYHLASTLEKQRSHNAYTEMLRGYVTQYRAEGKPLAVLAFNLGAAFPAVNYLPVTFPYRYHHLWTLPGIARAEKESRELTPAMQEAGRRTLQVVADDFRLYPPALVVVDENPGLDGALRDFDMIEYFKQNLQFKSLWRGYRRVGGIQTTEEQYTVYAKEKP